MKKIFILGCSRSGTSVVQKRVVETTKLYSLPETAFFSIPNDSKKSRRENVLRLINYSRVFGENRKASDIILGIELLGVPVNDFINTGQNEFLIFEKILNLSARLNSKHGWVEKTPLHFLRIDEILTNYNDAFVIFVVRNGLDVSASIRDRANKYEEFSHQKDFRVYTKLWNKSIGLAKQFSSHSRVIIFDFDSFVKNPNEYFRPVMDEINSLKVSNEEDLVNIEIATRNELWKSGLNKPITPQKSRVSDVFTNEEIKEIEQELDFNSYNELLSNMKNSFI